MKLGRNFFGHGIVFFFFLVLLLVLVRLLASYPVRLASMYARRDSGVLGI